MFEEKIEETAERAAENADSIDFDFNSLADDYMEFARKYHEQYLIKGRRSDLDNAVNNYIDAVKYNPDAAEAYYRLAALLWDKGEISLSSAIDQCRSAVKLSPDNPDAHIYAAFFLEAAKNYDEAEKELKEALRLSPVKSARSRLSLASLYYEKMNSGSVSPKILSQLLYYSISGGLTLALDYPSLKMLCRNLSKNFSLMFYENLGKFWEKTKNYTMAVKVYDKAAQKTGRNEIFYSKIGDINVKEGSCENAGIFYLKALENNPNNKELLAKAASLASVCEEGGTDTAIDCYTKLLSLGEDTAATYYELGHLYLKKEDFINAINAFRLALEKDEKNPFYHNALAFALVKAEQYDEACRHYAYAIERNPDSEWTAVVCQTLASLYYRVYDDIDRAVDLLKDAIILDRSNDESFTDLGDIYMDTDDADSAIQSYCEAVKLNPKKASIYNKLSIALWRKNYLEEAITACCRAINADNDFYAAYNNLGVIYLEGVNNIKEAKKLFNQALKIKRDYAAAHFNLGRAYTEEGNRIEAAKCFQTALELNEIEPELDSEDIKQRLHSLFDV